MSTIISTETKEVEVVKEARTYKLEIHTPKNEPYWLKLHHEIAELHDGAFKNSEIDAKVSPIVLLMTDILSRQDTFTYTDLDGQEQTVKSQDVPLIVQAFTNVLREEGS